MNDYPQISANWNKINVDGIIDFGNYSKYFSVKKSQFPQWIQGVNAFQIVVGSDRIKNKVVNQLQSAGFTVVVDANYGFSWDTLIIANK